MTDNNTEDRANMPISWVKSANGIFETYANMIHVTWSLDDVRIRFGQLINDPATPNPGQNFIAISDERAAITLTWRNAKLLRDQLTRVVDSYENANHQIDLKVTLPESS